MDKQEKQKLYSAAQKCMETFLEKEGCTLWELATKWVTNGTTSRQIFNFFSEKDQQGINFGKEIEWFVADHDGVAESFSYIVIAGYEMLHENRNSEKNEPLNIQSELKKRQLSNADFLKWAATKGVVFSDKEVSTQKNAENLTKSATLAWLWFFSEC